MVNKIKCKCADYDYSNLLKLLKIIAEANRLRIICFLKQKERCVCEIVEALDIPHNLASHHLKELRSVGLLTSLRKGKYIFYRVNNKALNSFLLQIKKAVGENHNEK
ncbi:MAG: metalloregulator ArsR/SmtB family transcription factor [Candidatus Saganbacteria bacterium]|nr:metalloregulator ArsR/SmtB family transcription factor [Candidatus Saganbacteria bacterium]